MNNNLINISNRDIVYQTLVKSIGRFLPKELRVVYNNSPHIPIITGDSYFLHYSIYPMLREKNDDQILEKVRKFTMEYIGREDYQRIKTITTLDDEMSRIYAFELAKTILEKIKEEINKRAQQGQGPSFQQLVEQAIQQQLTPNNGSSQMRQQQQGGQQPQQNTQNQAIQQLQQAVQQALKNIVNNEMKMKTIQKEVQEKTETANKVREMMGGQSAGKEPGTFQKLINLTDKILETEIGKEILTFSDKLLKNIPRFTHKIKKRDIHGDELAGYRTTKRIERAIPRELALPEELFLKKFANGFLSREKLSTYEGAFYVLIDKSGSMESGNKTLWSRSVALALFKLAQRKGRKYFLRFFDKNVYDLQSNPSEILESILTVRCDGGTSIDRALYEALNDLKELKEYTNTIILITDGEDVVSTVKADLRRVNAKLISIMIQGHNKTLKELSDIFMTAQLTPEGALKVVEVVR